MKKFSGSSGQTLTDRMTAAKHSISGAGLAKVVCKSTTEELIPPKPKHLSYLIECTKESNVSIPELANNLLERLNNAHWAVVFKSLISIHHLMNYGNERFTQYLASNNCRLSLPNFQDRTTIQGSDMSRFISRYSNYIQEKAMSYRALAFDFCKVKRGSEDAALRTMNVERLLKTLPSLLMQFDALLAFDVTVSELSNNIINSAFLLLYKDASRLFVVFNDGIINMLTKFFESMNKKQCKDSLEIYRKFLTRSERLNEFSRIAESAGVERADLAILEKHPTSFLEAMESHLGQTDGKKISRSSSSNSIGSAATTAAPAASAATAAASGGAAVLTEAQRQQLLQEEQEYLDRLQAQRQKQNEAKPQQQAKAAASNEADFLFGSPPKLEANAHSNKNQAAISFTQFETPTTGNAAIANTGSFGFGNFPAAPAAAPLSSATGFPAFQQPALTQPAPFVQQQQQQQHGSGFDPFGSVLEPTRNNSQQSSSSSANNNSGTGVNKKSAITGDLDSSIASLASSLSMKDAQFGRGPWNQQQQQQHQQQQQQQHGAVRISAGPSVNWAAAAQQQQQQQQMRPMGVGITQMPMGGVMPAAGANPFLPAGGWQPAVQPNNGAQANVNDPFGAL